MDPPRSGNQRGTQIGASVPVERARRLHDRHAESIVRGGGQRGDDAAEGPSHYGDALRVDRRSRLLDDVVDGSQHVLGLGVQTRHEASTAIGADFLRERFPLGLPIAATLRDEDRIASRYQEPRDEQERPLGALVSGPRSMVVDDDRERSLSLWLEQIRFQAQTLTRVEQGLVRWVRLWCRLLR